MKAKFLLLNFLILFTYSFTTFSQQRPQIRFEELMINAELDYKNIIEARDAALMLQIPISIYLEEGIFIEAKAVESGKPVYAVIRNLLHPYENSDVMFYEEVEAVYNLEGARINYGSGNNSNPDIGLTQTNSHLRSTVINYLLVSESSNNSVMLLDFDTGDLIAGFYTSAKTPFLLPKQARQSPRNTISISDQTEDDVI
jgi:hypothetical protein